MTAFETICLLLGISLGALVLAELLRVGAFSIRLKKQPPAMRVSPEVLARLRSEIVHNAMKRIK